jgi:hypothetical protein
MDVILSLQHENRVGEACEFSVIRGVFVDDNVVMTGSPSAALPIRVRALVCTARVASYIG